MGEKLTACMDCEHEGEYSARDGFTCHAPGLLRFCCHDGTVIKTCRPCSLVNTDGHCGYFTAKPTTTTEASPP